MKKKEITEFVNYMWKKQKDENAHISEIAIILSKQLENGSFASTYDLNGDEHINTSKFNTIIMQHLWISLKGILQLYIAEHTDVCEQDLNALINKVKNDPMMFITSVGSTINGMFDVYLEEIKRRDDCGKEKEINRRKRGYSKVSN